MADESKAECLRQLKPQAINVTDRSMPWRLLFIPILKLWFSLFLDIVPVSLQGHRHCVFFILISKCTYIVIHVCTCLKLPCAKSLGRDEVYNYFRKTAALLAEYVY